MKLFLKTLLPLFYFTNAFAQEMQNVEIRSVEYVWERQAGDDRIVFGKDSNCLQMLRSSVSRAVAEKWNSDTPPFDIKVNKLPYLRTQPKFITSVASPDTSTCYIFLQLFDKSVNVYPSRAIYSARIEARYRLVKAGTTLADKTRSYKIRPRTPVHGQIAIRRYPFYSSEFKYLCDTIISSILNDEATDEREISLDPACGYAEAKRPSHLSSRPFKFNTTHQSISVEGDGGFAIVLDSINLIKTGKKKHGTENTVSGLLTFFANVDTDKKRSTLYMANHTFNDGSTVYHSYINYLDTKVAERHREKDEQGFKSVTVGEYQPGWRQIIPSAQHFITMNGDTVSAFSISYRRVEEHFNKCWNGSDTATIDSMPVAFNNPAMFEMEMKGSVDGDRFMLVTRDEGKMKTVSLNDEEVLLFYCNSGMDGVLQYHHLNERQLKIVALLCIMSDNYYNYK